MLLSAASISQGSATSAATDKPSRVDFIGVAPSRWRSAYSSTSGGLLLSNIRPEGRSPAEPTKAPYAHSRGQSTKSEGVQRFEVRHLNHLIHLIAGAPVLGN